MNANGGDAFTRLKVGMLRRIQPRIRKFHAFALVALTAALSRTSVPAGEPEVTCGNESQRACKGADWEYWAQFRFTGRNRACEHDLVELDGVCVNGARRTIPKSHDWTAWALAEQRYGIGESIPVSRIVTVGTHNSYSNSAQGFTNPVTQNQVLSLTDQLQVGVRSLELDVSFYGSKLRLCHGKRLQGCPVPGFSASRLAADALIEIRNWLVENPGEVVILKVDDDLEHGDELLSAEIKRYLGNFVYQNVPVGRPWPTMGEMRASGKQILVIVQTDSRIAPDAWIWKGLNHVSVEHWMKCRQSGHCNWPCEEKTGLLEVAEGRAVSNALGAHTGLFSEQGVREASESCVGLIGLDYLKRLSQPVWPFYRISQNDSRIQASIWSWSEGDYGLNGPALLNVATGRWESVSPDQQHPLACATGETITAWKVTGRSYTWSTRSTDACKAEFGEHYRFAFPTNGADNRQIRRVAEARGERGVWLAYEHKR